MSYLFTFLFSFFIFCCQSVLLLCYVYIVARSSVYVKYFLHVLACIFYLTFCTAEATIYM
uniref:Uncharacterized protein n=1 Tax=virus sp. ctHG14 TaxID=2827626 RepID=A0A8S5RJI6_9VIRU|nr:MAG TPA: hypothetical protein [virus sp. ctHG14]